MARPMRHARPRRHARRLTFVARRVAGAIAALCGLLVACNSDGLLGLKKSTTFTVGTALHDIAVGSLSRSYVLHVPTKRPTASNGTLMAYPLMIVLHGSSATGADIRATSNMDAPAFDIAFAMPNPMPLLPPVIMASLPSRRKD